MAIRTHLPKPKKIGQKKEAVQTMMFTATLVPQVHQMVLTFAPRHELLDLNRDMSPNKNSQPLPTPPIPPNNAGAPGHPVVGSIPGVAIRGRPDLLLYFP